MNNPGQLIKNKRVSKGISQLDLELSLGLATGSICRIEKGVVNPSKETLIRISDALKFDIYETLELIGLEFSSTSMESLSNIELVNICRGLIERGLYKQARKVIESIRGRKEYDQLDYTLTATSFMEADIALTENRDISSVKRICKTTLTSPIRSSDLPIFNAMLLNLESFVYFYIGEYKNADTNQSLAVKLAQNFEGSNDYYILIADSMIMALHSGALDRANDYFIKLKQVLERIKNPRTVSYVKRRIAIYLSYLKPADKQIEQFLLEAMSNSMNGSFKPEMVANAEELGKYYLTAGNYALSEKFLTLSNNINHQIRGETSISRASLLNGLVLSRRNFNLGISRLKSINLANNLQRSFVDYVIGCTYLLFGRSKAEIKTGKNILLNTAKNSSSHVYRECITTIIREGKFLPVF